MSSTRNKVVNQKRWHYGIQKAENLYRRNIYMCVHLFVCLFMMMKGKSKDDSSTTHPNSNQFIVKQARNFQRLASKSRTDKLTSVCISVLSCIKKSLQFQWDYDSYQKTKPYMSQFLIPKNKKTNKFLILFGLI